MLKRLVIVGLLIPFVSVGGVVAQDALKGTPKQGIAKQETSKKGHEQPQGQTHSQPAKNLAPSTPQPAALTHDESAETNRENLQIQRSLMYFTGGLVGVGFLQLVLIGWQAILLHKTREDVHTQAEWMGKQAGYMQDQTKVLGDSVAAAQASADAANSQIQMVKNKERGRLRIEFGNPDLANDPDPENGYELPFRLILDGTTQVFIREHFCFAGIHHSGDPVGEPWWGPMGIPATLTPEDRIFKGSLTLITGEIPWGEPFVGVDEGRVSLVREENLHIFVRASIFYADIFGDEWELRFNRKWIYFWEPPPSTTIDLSAGRWESIGDNDEYEAKLNQSANPN